MAHEEASDVVERAVFCADGRFHYGAHFIEDDPDPERYRAMADTLAGHMKCGGAPHVIAQRRRIVTEWEVPDA